MKKIIPILSLLLLYSCNVKYFPISPSKTTDEVLKQNELRKKHNNTYNH